MFYMYTVYIPVLLQTPPASVLFHHTWCQPTTEQGYLQYSVPESSQYKIVPSQKISIVHKNDNTDHKTRFNSFNAIDFE